MVRPALSFEEQNLRQNKIMTYAETFHLWLNLSKSEYYVVKVSPGGSLAWDRGLVRGHECPCRKFLYPHYLRVQKNFNSK